MNESLINMQIIDQWFVFWAVDRSFIVQWPSSLSNDPPRGWPGTNTFVPPFSMKYQWRRRYIMCMIIIFIHILYQYYSNYFIIDDWCFIVTHWELLENLHRDNFKFHLHHTGAKDLRFQDENSRNHFTFKIRRDIRQCHSSRNRLLQHPIKANAWCPLKRSLHRDYSSLNTCDLFSSDSICRNPDGNHALGAVGYCRYRQRRVPLCMYVLSLCHGVLFSNALLITEPRDGLTVYRIERPCVITARSVWRDAAARSRTPWHPATGNQREA